MKKTSTTNVDYVDSSPYCTGWVLEKIIPITLLKTNMTMENQPFEAVSPIKN